MPVLVYYYRSEWEYLKRLYDASDDELKAHLRMNLKINRQSFKVAIFPDGQALPARRIHFVSPAAAIN